MRARGRQLWKVRYSSEVISTGCYLCPSPNSEMSHWYLKLGVPQMKTICFPPAPLILVLVLYLYFWNATTLLSVSQACCACPFTLALITKSWWYFILPNFSVCLSLFHPHCHSRFQVSITSHLGDLISNMVMFPWWPYFSIPGHLWTAAKTQSWPCLSSA